MLMVCDIQNSISMKNRIKLRASSQVLFDGFNVSLSSRLNKQYIRRLTTTSTAAIVVSRRCFIWLQLSILHPSCRRVCGGGRQVRERHLSYLNQ